MRFRKTLTFLILATALAWALPARAEQKIVAPTLRSAQKRGTGILPVIGHGQGWPWHVGVAASLPRQTDVAPTLRSAHADLKVSATTPLLQSLKGYRNPHTAAARCSDGGAGKQAGKVDDIQMIGEV